MLTSQRVFPVYLVRYTYRNHRGLGTHRGLGIGVGKRNEFKFACFLVRVSILWVFLVIRDPRPTASRLTPLPWLVYIVVPVPVDSAIGRVGRRVRRRLRDAYRGHQGHHRHRACRHPPHIDPSPFQVQSWADIGELSLRSLPIRLHWYPRSAMYDIVCLKPPHTPRRRLPHPPARYSRLSARLQRAGDPAACGWS